MLRVHRHLTGVLGQTGNHATVGRLQAATLSVNSSSR